MTGETRDPSSPAPCGSDPYWRGRIDPRREARSRVRARIAASLLGPGGGRILDLGCGPGWGAEELARRGFAVDGADASAAAVAAARGRGIDARLLDIERDEIPSGYDGIVCLEVLEHLGDPRGVLARILDAAGGRGAVISIPNEFHILRRLGILAGRPGFGGHDDPHIRHFGWGSARRLIAEAGGEILAWRPVSILPPRLGAIARAGDLAARLAPSLASISFIFRVGRAGR